MRIEDRTPIIAEEKEWVMGKMKKGNSAGECGASVEMLKAMGYFSI